MIFITIISCTMWWIYFAPSCLEVVQWHFPILDKKVAQDILGVMSMNMVDILAYCVMFLSYWSRRLPAQLAGEEVKADLEAEGEVVDL